MLIPDLSTNREENGLAIYVSAHPDDWDVGWGGQIIKNDAGRYPVLLIVVTDGAADFGNHYWDVKRGSYEADLEIQRVSTPKGERRRYFSRNLMNARLASLQRRAMYLKIENVFTMNFPDSLARHYLPQIAQNISDIILRAVKMKNYTLHLIGWHAGRNDASNAYEHSDHMAAGDATAIAIQDVMLKLGLKRLASRFTTLYEEPRGTINPVQYETVDSVWSERLKVWEMMWEPRFLELFRNPLFPRNPEPYVNYTFKALARL